MPRMKHRLELGRPICLLLILLLALAGQSARSTTAQTRPDRWRVGVSALGLHRISRADLVAAGLPVDDIDPRRLQISRSRDGVDQPVDAWVEGESDGRFDVGDALYFYGQGMPRPPEGETIDFFGSALPKRLGDRTYTDEQAYWLTLAESAGSRMAPRTARPGDSAPEVTQVRQQVWAEESNTPSHGHQTSDEIWFWERINENAPVVTRTYGIRLDAPVASQAPARVEAELASRKEGVNHTRFSLPEAGLVLEDQRWEGRRTYRMSAEIPQAAIVEGINTLQLELIQDEARSDLLFDWLRVEYTRRLRLDAGQLSFAVEGEGQRRIRVTGASSAAPLALDVSDPDHPLRLTDIPAPQDGSLVFEAPAGRRYAVAEPAAALAPSSFRRSIDTGLADNERGADYIIIAPSPLLEGSRRLAERREAQGLRSLVVDAAEIYDRFNDGNYHPKAVRAFLRHAVTTWPAPAPRFVLLVGDGHWNFRDDGGGQWSGGPLLMPPYLNLADPFQGMVDTTNRLAAVIDDDLPLAPDGSDDVADLAIGRLPVSNPAELQVVIDKIVAFEDAPPADWRSRVLLVADNSDALPQPPGWAEYARNAERVADELSTTEAEISRLYLDDWFNAVDGRDCGPAADGQRCPGAVRDLVARIGAGALFVNYVGHGAIGNWAHENMLRNRDVADIDNPGRLPVVTSWNCLDGYWLYPGLSSLAETLLRQPGKGAVAAFAPAGLGIPGGGVVMSTAFYRSLRGGATYLGEASLASLESVRDSYMTDIYVLLGDPALRLNLPPQLLDTATRQPDGATATPRPSLGRVYLPRLARISP